MASLSKTIGAAFALEFFKREGVDAFTTSVNDMFRSVYVMRGMDYETNFHLTSAPDCPPEWADEVLLYQLMNHS